MFLNWEDVGMMFSDLEEWGFGESLVVIEGFLVNFFLFLFILILLGYNYKK